MEKAVHLEDAIERIGNLPLDIRRQMELIRELDSQWNAVLRELKAHQNAYLENARRLVKVGYLLTTLGFGPYATPFRCLGQTTRRQRELARARRRCPRHGTHQVVDEAMSTACG